MSVDRRKGKREGRKGKKERGKETRKDGWSKGVKERGSLG